jgi:ribosomal protein S18 acetylase RimI-like enzyme
VENQAKIKIRKARSDDAASIASVLYSSFKEYEPFYTQKAFSATTPASDKVLERMKEGPVWVALQNDAIVGTISAAVKDDRLYIRGMAVLPTAREQRIGWLLLKYVEKFAVKKGIKRLSLSTTPFLKRAIRLYEHFGFHRTSEGPHNLFGTPLFTMEKILKPED